MTWVKFDDGFTEHPKMERAGGDAGWLHVCAICWSARALTDGRVPFERVSKLSDRRRVNDLCNRLVMVKSWHAPGDFCDSTDCPASVAPVGPEEYVIHDFWAQQPTKAQVMVERDAAKERMRRRRAEKRSGNVRANNDRSSAEVREMFGDPDPTRPVTTSSNRDTSTTSTANTGGGGEVSSLHPTAARAIQVYAEADIATRSVTSYDDQTRYRSGIVRAATKRSWADLTAELSRNPTATAVDLAVIVLGLDRDSAARAERDLQHREAS